MKKISLVAFLFVLFIPALAFAADGQQAVWQVILQHLMEIVVALGVPVLLILLKTYLKKKGIEADMGTLNELLSKAVGFAEQMGKKALKDGAEQTDNAQKLDWALSKGRELAEANKLDQWVVDKLESLIEAKLGEQNGK